jgi:hypothetical protein
MLQQRIEIVGERIEVVAASGIVRAAVTTTIIGDAADSALRKLDHLGLPDIGIHCPCVHEYDRRTVAPLPVKQTGTIVGRYVRHFVISFLRTNFAVGLGATIQNLQRRRIRRRLPRM